MQDLVKMVVNDFTKVHNTSLLDLNLVLGIKLESCGVNEAHISDVVLPVD